jgi:hypothetical protein
VGELRAEGVAAYGRSGGHNNGRKPTRQFEFEGEFQFRFAERACTGLLFQEPPHRTRDAPRRSVPCLSAAARGRVDQAAAARRSCAQ